MSFAPPARPYPPDRYHGDTGELSARGRPTDAAHELDFLYAPPGGLHGFRNESGEPVSMLILFAPGAPREAYFEGLAELGRTGVRPSPKDMAEFYLRHDTYWA